MEAVCNLGLSYLGLQYIYWYIMSYSISLLRALGMLGSCIILSSRV